MATKTKQEPIVDRLKRLYQIQIIDSKVDEIAVLKGALPMEVSDLEDEITGLQKRLERLNENIEDIKHELNAHEVNISNSNALIERYEKQLDEVKNNREYDALTKEIELQKLEIQLSEKKIRETNEKLEVKQGVFDNSNEKLEAKNKELEIKKVELAEIIEKTEKEEAKLVKKSDTSKKKVEERLLKAYNKVRTRYRNGLAVVTVDRDSCGGCFNKVPPQVQIEIKALKPLHPDLLGIGPVDPPHLQNRLKLAFASLVFRPHLQYEDLFHGHLWMNVV